MAQVPNPKSQEQIVGEMLADWISRTGVNDINTGSLTTQIFEVVALMVARTSGDAFQILRDLSVDRAEGEALRRIATDEGLKDIPARVATGAVTVTDSSFTKISTKIYAGTRAPNVGSTKIYVSDASEFPISGFIYIGRGTPNVEGPIALDSLNPPVQIGSNYWEITLSTGTTKFHNINESVILAQGGTRTIPAGTGARAPSSGATPDINFVVTQSAVILDGETSIANVQVSAQEPGTVGNVPIGAINEFSAPPFPGAEVTNPLPLKTGRDVETDEELRIRIKRARLSRGLGTSLAVKNSVIGATPSDENSTIVSSEIVTSTDQTTLYIDDNTGYEQKTEGVGIEYLVDSALGGEINFQLETGGRQTSVAKAFVISNEKAPFDVAGTDKIAVSVGGITTEHTFSDSDFISPGGATAYEIVASINSNSNLNFQAATSEGGTKVVLQAKAEDNERIQAVAVTIGRNAAELMGFPFNEVETLRLFKNKQPLSKDGLTATIKTETQASWSSLIASGDTLILSVDNTASITYTINDSDFIQEGTYSSASSTNSLESWVNVFNAKLTGVTASIVGDQIFLTSNLDAADRAKLEIDPISSLVSKNMFSVAQGLISLGKSSDYEFSRNTAQIKLKTPLSVGDELAVGSRETEARLESSRIVGGSITLSADAYFWILFDDSDAEIINTGLIPTSLLSVSKPAADIVRFTSSEASAFSNVQIGDYVIIWSEELSSSNRFEARVNSVTSNTLDIKVTSAEYAAAIAESAISYQEGFVVVRTSKVPEKLKVASGTKAVSQIADELSLQTKSAEFLTIDDEILVIKTITRASSGSVFVATFNDSAKSIGFIAGSNDKSKDSLLAFSENGYKEGSFPSFVHSSFSSESSALPPDSYISTISSLLDPSSLNLDPNYSVGYLQPYDSAISDALSTSEATVLNDYLSTTLTLGQDSLIKRIRQNDRYYFAEPLNFGHQDEAVVVLDADSSNKTFSIPLYRKAATNTPLLSSTGFNALDVDGGSVAFSQYFVSGSSVFDFSNFKILMQAKRVIDMAASEDAILYRSEKWGRSGEKINVGYIYPTSADSSISHTVSIDSDINVRISLKSGAAIKTTIDGTTEWDVTVTPDVPVVGVDQVTYSYSAGTSPGLGSLVGGEYITITSGSELDPKNTGTFRVSTESGFAPTTNSFTVVRRGGEALNELAKSTLVASVFSFYQTSNTTAAEIVSYVSSSTLADLISAALVDDSGTSGAGTIDRSTEEDSDFTVSSYSLLDGINWILSSNLTGSPQFTLKRPLSYTTDTGYKFNDGENLRIVPTTIDQVVRFTNVLAVTGLTTLGNIQLSSGQERLQFATNLLGGDGSIQIIGGSANSVSTPVIGSTLSVDGGLALTSVSRSGLSGLHSDQWVKLSASFLQQKETLFKSTASASIDADYQAIGKAKIRVFGRTLTDRHFGKPRNHVRTNGRTFRVEKQGDLVCISWNEIGSSPFFSKTLNLNATGVGTVDVQVVANSTEADLTIQTGPVNFTEVSIGDKISVSGMVNQENDGLFLVVGVSQDGKTLRILNQNAIDEIGTAYGIFTFDCTSSVSEGDSVVLGDQFDVLNQGTFKVIRRYLNSIYIDNPNVVEEMVTLSSDTISLGYDGTTSFDVLSTNNRFVLKWDGSGTEPTLGVAVPGDEITLGSDFSSNNQGTFMVTKAEPKLPEITRANCVAGSLITSGDYWEIKSAGDATSYYIWYNVDGGGGNPMLPGKTGVEITISSVSTSLQVASATAAAIDSLADFSVETSENEITISTSGYAETTSASEGNMDVSFDIEILQKGQRTFLEAINPAATAESGIVITDVLTVLRPKILFYEYDATMPNDSFVITNNFLGVSNIGTWKIDRVIDQDTILVSGNLSDQENTSFFGYEESVYVQESLPYVGYKKISAALADPANTQRGLLLFDTDSQFSKINDIANVQISAINKLNFNTTLTKGLDSYRYHTGLIAEANRIVYGDPRDPITYPGVSAAGAEIFIKEPLFRRVQVSIDVRIETGIPFVQITEQVRTNLTALIDSNPIGQSIAISDIVESVNTIPGVRAVAISSPLYNAANDTIKIEPSEKARIIDPTADITVRQIGA